MRIAYFFITEQGRYLAEKLNAQMPGTLFRKESLKDNMKKAFLEYDGLVCIMATGIVVRILAPLFVHKKEDPAIVVMDSKGEFAISLLSGHLGGANYLARKAAAISGGQAVITTATDVEDRFAFDLFAKEQDLHIENIEELKFISSALLKGEYIQVLTPYQYKELYQESIIPYKSGQNGPVVVIDEKIHALSNEHVLMLRPKTLYIGIGCKFGMEGQKIIKAVETVLNKYGYSRYAIAGIATIPKKAKEEGIIETANFFHAKIHIIDPEKIKSLHFDKLKIKQSDFVEKTVGVPSVSTASAYIASDFGHIVVDKNIFPGITISISIKKDKKKYKYF